jgi:LAO/AO transport system kinase
MSSQRSPQGEGDCVNACSARHEPVAADPVRRLVARLVAGEQLALSRAITIVENGLPEASAILAALKGQAGHAIVVGVTGPPGAGKSTLIDALIGQFRQRGSKVSVLAVDPSSSLTGGAILGDRIRMGGHTGDAGVFVRSLASRGHLGGLFRAAWDVLQVMDAARPDVILIETVGAGQSEVEIADYAHVKIVVCAPGLGDDVQASKAGILEIADLLVVNKSDHPRAADTVRQLEAMLQLRDPGLGTAKILSTVATTGAGLPELADAIVRRGSEVRAGCGAGSALRVRRMLADAVARLVRQRVLDPRWEEVDVLGAQLAAGAIGMDAAAAELLARAAAAAPSGGPAVAPGSAPRNDRSIA